MQVLCSQNDINDVLFEDMKVLVAPIIGIPTPSWLEEEAIIEKKEMNISVRF